MSTDYRLSDVSELAARKRFSVKPDPINPGYCNVWRKTDGGAETLAFEEAIELLNEWPDVNKKWRLESSKNEQLKRLAKRKSRNLVFHRPGGIEIEHYSGMKTKNPATGGVKFSYNEAAEWLLKQQDRK